MFMLLLVLMLVSDTLSKVDVGKVPVSLKVLQGQAYLEVDIPKPKDFPNWMENLKLVYGSSSSEHLAGIGWGIEGISKIHRYFIRFG